MAEKKGGGTLIGFWLESENHKACEIARISGYDVVIFDMEHGTVPDSALDHLIPFCNGIGLVTYVRVSEATQARIQAALDMGADGVILPQIRDLQHARASAAFSKYPPRGLRGLGFSRIQSYSDSGNEFIAKDNARRKCYVMIETRQALEDAGEIARLDTVDGLFVGPSDLSLARGRGIFSANAADVEDMKTVARAAKAHNKPWAAAAGNPGYRKEAIAAGAAFVTAADDLSAMMSGFKSLLGEAGDA
jgi:4-hydroxy-2-oxoheptanedioate aldolase